ncbi:MAG: glycosyltransferase family 39 protein [Candidatus Bathyarchaeota archaeon]|nr:glycosyltransferase family 39 protein [Candidatus Bathyarchaeota archaeon]
MKGSGKSFLCFVREIVFIERGNMVRFSVEKREVAILAVLLLGAFAVRVLLFPLQGYQNDMSTYQYWFNAATEQGIRPFYTYVLQNAGWIDYPPFNVYIFWAFGSLAHAVSTTTSTFFVKLAPTLFDLATSALIYLFVRKQLTFKQSLITTALYAFNPAIIFNVAVWGQFDAIYTLFLVLSLMLALKRKPEVSAVALAVALLTKPQGIALLPLIAVLIFKKSGVKRLLTSIGAFVATIFLVILPFEWSNPVTFLSDIYFGAYSGYEYTSINAFNLWGLFGLWVPDGSLFIVGWVLFGVFAAFTLFVLHKRFHVSGEMLAVFAAFMLFFAFFMLPTRIHERYLFPAVSMLAIMFMFSKRARTFYVAITVTLLINQAYILYWLNAYVNAGLNYSPNLTGDPVVLAVSVINLVLFLYGVALLWSELRGQSMFKAKPTEPLPDRKEPTGELHSEV